MSNGLLWFKSPWLFPHGFVLSLGIRCSSQWTLKIQMWEIRLTLNVHIKSRLESFDTTPQHPRPLGLWSPLIIAIADVKILNRNTWKSQVIKVDQNKWLTLFLTALAVPLWLHRTYRVKMMNQTITKSLKEVAWAEHVAVHPRRSSNPLSSRFHKNKYVTGVWFLKIHAQD